jgi:putative sigma-54 modulation protein
MNITYYFQNLEASDGIKDYCSKKIEKLSAHFNTLIAADVRCKVEKLDQIVEIAINADNHQFIASEKHEDMYAAVDLVEDKLEKQVRRHKEKVLDKKHRPRT